MNWIELTICDTGEKISIPIYKIAYFKPYSKNETSGNTIVAFESGPEHFKIIVSERYAIVKDLIDATSGS